MSKEERYAEHTVAWELPKCDTVTKGNYNLADIEMKYMPIQTEVVSDSKDKIIADLQSQLAEKEKEIEELKLNNKKYFTDSCRANKEIAYKLKQQNQKAIEQLEKVKKKILSYEEIYYQFLESGAKIPVFCVENFRVKQYIDQQINELKGDK